MIFSYIDGLCVTKCQEGFYPNMIRECEPCHHECRSCGGPYYDDCDSCEDDRRLVDGKCVNNEKTIHCNPLHFLNGKATPSCELAVDVFYYYYYFLMFAMKQSGYFYHYKIGEPHE